MRIKRIIPFIGMMAIAISGMAQKVSVDNKSIRIPFRQMAKKPIAESERTFTVIPEFREKTDSRNRMSEVRAEGLTYVNTDEAGIVVVVKYSGIVDCGSNVETISSKVKGKDGTESVVNTYRAIINYSYDMEFNVLDRSGKLLDNVILHKANPHVYSGKIETAKSPEFKNIKEANAYIEEHKESIFEKAETEALNNVIQRVRWRLEGDYGYAADVHKTNVQFLDSKKHPEYEEHQKLCNDIVEGLKPITAKGGVEEASIALEPAEAQLKQVLEKYADPKDKNHVKMRFLAYYNLAVIYAHTERLAMAKEMLTKAIDNDYEVRDCKKLKEWVEEQETRLEANKMTVLHFPTPESEEIDEAHPAKWILAIRAEKEEAARKAREAVLNADIKIGELSVEVISPTRAKIVIDVTHEHVKPQAKTIKFIVLNGFFLDYNDARRRAMEGKNYDKFNVEPFVISEDGSHIETEINGLTPNEGYDIVAYTKVNGSLKTTNAMHLATQSFEDEEWTDLGLSVKWASRNIGAKKASKLGNLYTWYDTKPYEAKEAVPHDIAFDQLPSSIAGDANHDAATAAYGEGAQIPTLAQWQELFSRCTVRRIRYNRVGGYYFESRITNKAIFIPFTDFVSDCDPRGNDNCGFYWTSEKSTDGPSYEGENTEYIRCYRFGEVMKQEGNIRHYGKLHIRAVKK